MQSARSVSGKEETDLVWNRLLKQQPVARQDLLNKSLREENQFHGASQNSECKRCEGSRISFVSEILAWLHMFFLKHEDARCAKVPSFVVTYITVVHF